MYICKLQKDIHNLACFQHTHRFMNVSSSQRFGKFAGKMKRVKKAKLNIYKSKPKIVFLVVYILNFVFFFLLFSYFFFGGGGVRGAFISGNDKVAMSTLKCLFSCVRSQHCRGRFTNKHDIKNSPEVEKQNVFRKRKRERERNQKKNTTTTTAITKIVE